MSLSALIVFWYCFILIEDIHKNKQPKITSIAELSYYTVVLIGFFQLIAAVYFRDISFRGHDRRCFDLGCSRTVATEFTFFLAIPVMFGAALFKLVKFGFSFTPLEIWILVVGLVTAFITSIIAIKFLMQYIKKHTFKAFGWYRIILGLFGHLLISGL